MCYDSAAAAGTCSCQNSNYPHNWAGPTCTTAPPTDGPTPAPPTDAPTPAPEPEPEPTDAPTNAAQTDAPATDGPTTDADRRTNTNVPTEAPTEAPIDVTQSVDIAPPIEDWNESSKMAFRQAIVNLLASLEPPIIITVSDITFNEVSTKTNNPGELLQADAVVSERTATASVTTTVNYSVSVPSDTDQNKVTSQLDSAVAGSGTNTLSSYLKQNGIAASSTTVSAAASTTTQAPTMSGASANSVSRVAMTVFVVCAIVAWF